MLHVMGHLFLKIQLSQIFFLDNLRLQVIFWLPRQKLPLSSFHRVINGDVEAIPSTGHLLQVFEHCLETFLLGHPLRFFCIF